MAPVLEIKNLSKCYEGISPFSLEDVSLSLEKGYILGLIGPNGAGKTTLIKLMLNLIKKDSGVIKIFGKELHKSEKQIKERIGFVFDEPPWYQQLSVKEMTGLVSRLYKNWDTAAYNRYIREFGIESSKKIETLSKGMKMKYSLAIALSHRAELIIMDEPTSGLDPLFRAEILEILQQRIADEEISVIFSSHITTDLEKIADYIAFLKNGRLVFNESRETLSDRFRLVKGRTDLLDRDTSGSIDYINRRDTHFTGLTDDLEKTQNFFMTQIDSRDLIISRPSLEELMLTILKGEKKC